MIIGREYATRDAYLTADRAGRGVRLHRNQREAIWRLYEIWEDASRQRQHLTFPQLRRRAAELARDASFRDRYDGVVIDEAQDLQPTTLRMLVALCENRDRLFLTADPNQSTYGSGFRWGSVHEDLQFRGRTGVLRTNYRSTKRIMAGAASFLQGAELEVPEDPPYYPRNGPTPQVHIFTGSEEQVPLLAAFIRDATRFLRVGRSGCAVLTPSEDGCREIAKRLSDLGLPARFMTRSNVQLKDPSIKVMTLKSAKGLEFPVVALAGLRPDYPGRPPVDAPEDHLREWEQNGQRTLYVAMTRALDALLVLVPRGGSILNAAAFDANSWNISGA